MTLRFADTALSTGLQADSLTSLARGSILVAFLQSSGLTSFNHKVIARDSIVTKSIPGAGCYC